MFCGKKRKMGSLQSEVVVMGSLQHHVKIANGLHMTEHDLLPVRLTRNNFPITDQLGSCMSISLQVFLYS